MLKTRLAGRLGDSGWLARTAARKQFAARSFSGTSGTRCEIASLLIADTAVGSAAQQFQQASRRRVWSATAIGGDGADGRPARSQRFAQQFAAVIAAKITMRLPTTALVAAEGAPANPHYRKLDSRHFDLPQRPCAVSSLQEKGTGRKRAGLGTFAALNPAAPASSGGTGLTKIAA